MTSVSFKIVCIVCAVTGIQLVNGMQHYFSASKRRCIAGVTQKMAALQAHYAVQVKRDLVIAIEHGDEAAIRAALQGGAPVDAQAANGTTALMWAACYKKYDLIPLLVLAYKANLNARNARGDTALIHAVRYGSFATARLLIQYGADINAVNCFGESVLFFAVRRVFFVSGEGPEQAEFVKFLVHAGADVRGHDFVAYARTNQNHELAEFLMEYGAC